MIHTAASLPEIVSADPVRPHLRGWSHVVAWTAAVALCPLVIVFSPGLRLPVALFAGAVIGLFGISSAYHRLFWTTRARGLLRRLDHAWIFVTIAATYTPVALSTLADPARMIVLWAVWLGALGGTISQVAWPDAPRWLTVSLYGLVGWAILPVMHQVWQSLGVAGFVLLLTGGLLHTTGAIVYATKRPDPYPAWFGFHEIFHLFVVAAIATHYVVIAFVITP